MMCSISLEAYLPIARGVFASEICLFVSCNVVSLSLGVSLVKAKLKLVVSKPCFKTVKATEVYIGREVCCRTLTFSVPRSVFY